MNKIVKLFYFIYDVFSYYGYVEVIWWFYILFFFVFKFFMWYFKFLNI